MIKRASALGYAAALAVAPAWLSACSPITTATSPEPTTPEVLFSLSADEVHFENPSGMDVELVMDGVDAHTVWFTDRPDRESGAITTGKLVSQWDDGASFDADPPNAALVLHEPTATEKDGMAETLVAEIRGASYDPAKAQFRASLHVLSDEEASALEGNLDAHGLRHDTAFPARGGAASLFIDTESLDAVEAVPAPGANPSSSSPAASPSSSPSLQLSKPVKPEAQGMIKLCSSPTSCNNSTTANYTVNQTIYYQVGITQNVTMEAPMTSPSIGTVIF